ncbi:hypothetical protein FRC07_008053 [Ceratobasidium sp. 392]|nr:hypothetical protein FRC07_008053 [Ceratobasidium sp. 392]
MVDNLAGSMPLGAPNPSASGSGGGGGGGGNGWRIFFTDWQKRSSGSSEAMKKAAKEWNALDPTIQGHYKDIVVQKLRSRSGSDQEDLMLLAALAAFLESGATDEASNKVRDDSNQEEGGGMVGGQGEDENEDQDKDESEGQSGDEDEHQDKDESGGQGRDEDEHQDKDKDNSQDEDEGHNEGVDLGEEAGVSQDTSVIDISDDND